MKRATIFVGECGSKVSQFAKNAPLDVLIVLARDEHFLFWTIFYQRGDQCIIFLKVGLSLLYPKLPYIALKWWVVVVGGGANQ